MGLLGNMLNLSTYAEASRVEMDAAEKNSIKSATITDRQGEFGAWRTLDIETTTGARLSGVLSSKCTHASGALDVKNCKIFLTKVKKAGAPDSAALDRWDVQ